MRSVFWNAKLDMPSVWTLIKGGFIAAKICGRKLAMSSASRPNVGRLPAMKITAGVLKIAMSMLGILIFEARKGVL